MLLVLMLVSFQQGFGSHLSELLGYLSQHRVHTDVRFLKEGFLAHGADEERAGLPVTTDTGHAEVMTTWDGHRVSEDIQTDGTVDLLFCKHVLR